MIILDNVSYTYQTGTAFENTAVSDASIEIADGSLNALIGHTGSGKSTLMQLIGALIKPSRGRITVNGIDVTSPKADLRRIHRTVGLVFQYPEHQLFEETVYKDIAFGPMNMGLEEKEIGRRVRESAFAAGLDDKLLERSPFELSGGQKRRAAIAGVLAMEPKALILDEPAAGLDPSGREDIFKIIRGLHEKYSEMIIIFASHSMEEAAKYAERVIVMNEGRIELHGTVDEVFSKADRLRETGLNVPQITLLTDKLREHVAGLPDNIYTVKKAADAIEGIIKRRSFQ